MAFVAISCLSLSLQVTPKLLFVFTIEKLFLSHILSTLCRRKEKCDKKKKAVYGKPVNL